ncbi:MAG: hypothetical protein ABJM06_01885 [Gilvibacter sp.]
MINIFTEGGLFFMVPITVLFIITFGLCIKYLVNKSSRRKTIKLLHAAGLLAFIWGIFGLVNGFIVALDQIEFIDGVTLNQAAGELKRKFIPPLIGTLTFVIARTAILIFKWSRKEYKPA